MRTPPAGSRSLRERKKQMTRAAILTAAERLFEERGYDAVTVAQIADAANISVKTLFAYFRSKEDLAFADTSLIDAVIEALAGRSAGVTPEQAVAELIIGRIEDEDPAGIVVFQRSFGDSEALRSGLLRMWAEFEDRVTAELIRGSGDPATPLVRLTAIQVIGMIRMLTGPEALTALSAAGGAGGGVLVVDWLRSAASD
jgi:AcrR family transcriptional regulator